MRDDLADTWDTAGQTMMMTGLILVAMWWVASSCLVRNRSMGDMMGGVTGTIPTEMALLTSLTSLCALLFDIPPSTY